MSETAGNSKKAAKPRMEVNYSSLPENLRGNSNKSKVTFTVPLWLDHDYTPVARVEPRVSGRGESDDW